MLNTYVSRSRANAFLLFLFEGRATWIREIIRIVGDLSDSWRHEAFRFAWLMVDARSDDVTSD